MADLKNDSRTRHALLTPDEIAAEMFRRYQKAVDEGRIVDISSDDSDILPSDCRCTSFTTWRELMDQYRDRERCRARNAALARALRNEAPATDTPRK